VSDDRLMDALGTFIGDTHYDTGRAKRKDRSSVHLPTVYFVQGVLTRAVKIGTTGNVLYRMRQCQGYSPDRLVILGLQKGDADNEQGLHLRFVQDNLWGEWFSQSYELIEYIADHTQDVRTYYALNSPTLSARYLAGLDDFRPTLWLHRITTTPGSGVAEDDAE
jgi:hypothetical protein